MRRGGLDLLEEIVQYAEHRFTFVERAINRRTDEFSDEDFFPDDDFLIETIHNISPYQPIDNHDVSYLLQVPLAKIHILITRYDKSIPVITFLDTGVAASIMNPSILHPSHWKSYFKPFKATNGETFIIR